MDKKTLKLAQQYSLTEQMLRNENIAIELDVSGYKAFISEQVNSLDLSLESNPTKELSGGEIFNICGNAASILSLLDLLSKNLGESAHVGVFVAALGGFVVMSIVQARVRILQQVSSKDKESQSNDAQNDNKKSK